MLCSKAAVNSLPVHNNIADYIFWSFGIIGFIWSYFENRKLVRPVLGAWPVLYIVLLVMYRLNEPRHEKTGFLYRCENKDANQLRGNREADQRLCFRYMASTIPLLPKFKIFKPLAIFCDCTARFVSDLVRNPEDRFSRNEAQIKPRVFFSFLWCTSCFQSNEKVVRYSFFVIRHSFFRS